jgi:hypothetical protein
MFVKVGGGRGEVENIEVDFSKGRSESEAETESHFDEQLQLS